MKTWPRATLLAPPSKFEWTHRFKTGIAAGRAKFFDTDLQVKLEELTNKARRDPVNAQNYIAEGNRAIGNAGADWLPPEAIADVKLKHGQSVWFSAVSTLVDQNPITAKAQLNTGR